MLMKVVLKGHNYAYVCNKFDSLIYFWARICRCVYPMCKTPIRPHRVWPHSNARVIVSADVRGGPNGKSGAQSPLEAMYMDCSVS